MEGIPRAQSAVESESNIEQLSKWQELRDAAPAHAESLLQELGFTLDGEPSREKSEALKNLITQLSPVTPEEVAEKNHNRFVVKTLAAQLSEDLHVIADAQEQQTEAQREVFPAVPPADYPRREFVVPNQTKQPQSYQARIA